MPDLLLETPARVVTLCYPLALSSRPTPTELATEEEWRDPENVRAALLIQGILPKCYFPDRITRPQIENVGPNRVGSVASANRV